MKCDVCGSDNLEGAAYCEDCGAKLVVVPHDVSSTPPPAPAVTPVAPPPAPAAAPPSAPAATGASVQCPSCGADNPSTEAYCVDCGANLGSSPAPAAVSAPVPVAPAAAPAAAASGCARIALADGTKQFDLNKEITTMGRRSPADQIEPDVDLTNDDPESYVSRRHAQILRNDDEYIFEDVGSSNGSFLNNVKMAAGEQRVLRNGDRLRLGKTEFVFSTP